MCGEVRRLAALYMLFAVFLCATAVEETWSPRPAASLQLRRSEGLGPADLLPGALGDSLRRLGFRPLSGSKGGLFRILPRSAGDEAVPFWTLPGRPVEAKRELQRATADLAETAARYGARIQRTEWQLASGYLHLRLDLVLADGIIMPLGLQTRQVQAGPTMVVRRPVPPVVEPPVKRPEPGALPPTRLKPSPRPGPRVAIVLDDVGELAGTEEFLALPAQLTIAVLPMRRYSETYARQAIAAGRTVILHLPLEATRGINPGPGAIRTGWTPEQVQAQLLADLAAVPGAIGVNNHMGSLGTSDEVLMGLILAGLKEKGLCFLDSRTINTTVADRVARSLGEKYAARDIFLDPEGASVAEIQALLRKLMALAKRRGTAVGICHANRPNTLAALRATLPEFAAAGVEIVPVTELAH